MEKLLSIEEVAEVLGLEYKSVYRLVRNGEMPAARIGKVYRVSQADLAAFLEQSKQAVQAQATGRHFAQLDIRCGGCGAGIVSELGIAGRCEVCHAALCSQCFGLDKRKRCTHHDNNKENTE